MLRKVNTKLSVRLVDMGWRCYANKQYSPRECLEMSSFLTGVKDGDLESKVLDILEETDAAVDQKNHNKIKSSKKHL